MATQAEPAPTATLDTNSATTTPSTAIHYLSKGDNMLEMLDDKLQAYLTERCRLVGATDDPVTDLRRLWDQHVDFGLTHPDSYHLAYIHSRFGNSSFAARESIDLLQQAVGHLAGALAMTVDRATQLFHSRGVGFVMTQGTLSPDERDPDLSRIACESALSAILTERPARDPSRAVFADRVRAMQESLQDNDTPALTAAERQLMTVWLGQLAGQGELT
jgi:hypothetical protein